MTYEIDEESGQSPLLWDAGEGVCCAAFQLGACPHTESFDEDGYDDDLNYLNFDQLGFKRSE